MDQTEIAAMDFRNPPTGSFTAVDWPGEAQFQLGTETKDGFKITGLHITIQGLWYHVEAVREGVEVPDLDYPGMMHQDLLVPVDSPRVCNDDKINTPFNFQSLGKMGGEQDKEHEVAL